MTILANFAIDVLSIMNFVVSQTGFENKALMSEIILHTKQVLRLWLSSLADVEDVDTALDLVQKEAKENL